jgi:hypothetical protein
MAITAGVLSQTSVGSNSLQAAATAVTGAVGPVTYQWYLSTSSGFTPGVGNILTGETALSVSVSGLIPNTPYYLKLVATDTGASNATVTYAQLAITTTASALSPNQFAQRSILGQLDLQLNFNTVAALIDVSETTPLYAGSAVKLVDSASGVPKVVGCAAESDEVFGFINYNIKNVAFLAGNAAEISLKGNVMYLYATEAIARGVEVVLDLTSPGSVQAAAGETGSTIVGWAFDKAVASGQLIRVYIETPSFKQV